MTNDKRDNTIWVREYPDGDCEIGLLMKEPYGWVMWNYDFPYFFKLNLKKWYFIGDL